MAGMARIGIVLALLGYAAHGRADALDGEASTHGSAFWARMLRPEQVRAQRLVRDGRAELSPMLSLGILAATDPMLRAARPARALARARARFALAVELDPRSPEARLQLAEAWLEGDHDDAQALAGLLALRALAPSYEVERVALRLGLLHARRGELALATAEYEHALTSRCEASPQTEALLGLAQVRMLSGDLLQAEALFERAARESDPKDRVRALWGSAVANDRLGEHARARALARQAVSNERTPMATLHRTDHPLVPSYEQPYYEGIGALALAEDEPPGPARSALLATARSNFERYLAKSPANAPFRPQAQDHINALTRARRP